MNSFKARGWKSPGYHYLVTTDGTVHQLLSEEKAANGVKGYNAHAVHVAYMGGIGPEGQSTDNRSDAQKTSLRSLIAQLRLRYPKATVLGHRDISPDRNHNGIVDPWERIKDCPCFDAIKEYGDAN